MENLGERFLLGTCTRKICQRVSVTDSIHLTAKITPLLFVPYIHPWFYPNFI